MNTLRIVLLALLIGAASAGCAWYLWGILENLGHLRKKELAEDPSDLSEDNENLV